MARVKRQALMPGAQCRVRHTRKCAERRGQSWRSLAENDIESSSMRRGFWLSHARLAGNPIHPMHTNL